MDIGRVPNAKIAFRDVLQTIFRHRRKMSAVFFAVASSVIIWTLLSTEIYQSEAKVIVRPGREYLPLDPTALDSALPKPEFFEIVNAEHSVITSRHVTGKVVDVLGLDMVLGSAHPSWTSKVKKWIGLGSKGGPNPKDAGKSAEELALEAHDQGVRKIADGLGVFADGSTISLTFNSDDPDAAHIILDTIISEYLARHIEIFESKASPDFLKGRLGELADELEQDEIKLAEYRNRNDLASLESEKQSLVLAVSKLEGEISNTHALENSTREQLTVFEGAIANRSERVEISKVTGTQDSVSDFLRQTLLELRLQEKEFEALYNDSYRPLADLRTQIANVEITISEQEERNEETTVGLDENYTILRSKIDNAESALAGHIALRQTKEREIVGLRGRLRTMAGHEMMMSRLRRNVMTSEKAYLEYKASLTHAEANAALDQAQLSNVVVSQEATRPVRPIKPQKTRNCALGLFAGLLAAILLGCFLDYTDDTFKSQDDVENFLQLPVLATISEEEFRSCT